MRLLNGLIVILYALPRERDRIFNYNTFSSKEKYLKKRIVFRLGI